MFNESAELYDLIYGSFKNYATETADLVALIRAQHPNAKTILDVACGTGEHARLLTEQFGYEVDGLDLNPSFVRIARGKLPGQLSWSRGLLPRSCSPGTSLCTRTVRTGSRSRG